MDKKIASLLSLCMRARKLAAGEHACEIALRNGDAVLILIAEDASDNTKKKFTNKAFYYKVPVVLHGSRDEISKAIGKENRVVVAVTDSGFADGLLKNMEVGGCLK
jgi:ribosomal protein L7Ae-like RNA K-turn-binding protein